MTTSQTAVSVQNSLRSLLNLHFSAEATRGWHQTQAPVLPALDSSIWQPIFRGANTDFPHKGDRRVDLVLAIGSQNAVKKEYASAITGQIEKLGTKPSGISRSGRLDLRYLIANAIQTFTAQQLTIHTQDDPFQNPTLLATLILPQLEIYLATHVDTRFLLLQYPAEHLSTVLALQKLMGDDMIKVAGIMDGEDAGPVKAQKSGATFSKANFLLTSSATDSEIATFISTIWKLLISVSEFYIPEHAPRKVLSQNSLMKGSGSYVKATPLPSARSFSPLPTMNIQPSPPAMTSTAAQTTATSAALPTTSFVPRPASPAPSSKSTRASIKSATSARTHRTGISHKDRLRSRRAKRPKTPKTAERDSLSGELSEEEEYFDVEERRLMPLFIRREAQKGNSRKALKWLGLA